MVNTAVTLGCRPPPSLSSLQLFVRPLLSSPLLSSDWLAVMEEYSPDLTTLTDERLLAAVSDDSDLYLQKMPGNCRNISDEVFPGIHVGDQ